MKKIIVLSAMFCVLMTAFFFGCSKNPSNPSDNTKTATATPTAICSATATATATSTHISTLYSNASIDGFVSSIGGPNYAINNLDVGDNDTNDTYQSAVSFTLPPISSAITSAVLWIYLNSYSGTPLTSFGSVQVSAIVPNYATGNTIPYLIYSSNTSIGTICNSYAVGWYHLDVTAAVEDDRFNNRPASQFRIYFNSLSNGNNSWDTMYFYAGEFTSLSPYLEITY